MCQDIYVNLKAGGRFVAINNNPLQPVGAKPDSKVTPQGNLEEGCPLKIQLRNVKTREFDCPPFLNYFWKKQTYEAALKEAGFKEIIWHPFQLDESKRSWYSNEFWDEYIQNTNLTILEARK